MQKIGIKKEMIGNGLFFLVQCAVHGSGRQ